MKKLLLLFTAIIILTMIFVACSPSDDKAAEKTPDINSNITTEDRPIDQNTLTTRYDMDGDGRTDTVTLRQNTLFITLASSNSVTEYSYLIDPPEDNAYDYLFTGYADNGALVLLVDEYDGQQRVSPFYFSGAVLTPVKWEFDYKNYSLANDSAQSELFSVEWASSTLFTIRCSNYNAQKSFSVNTAKYRELTGLNMIDFDRSQTPQVINTTLGISSDNANKIGLNSTLNIDWLITFGGFEPTSAACYVRTTFKFDAANVMYKLINVEFKDTTDLVSPQ